MTLANFHRPLLALASALVVNACASVNSVSVTSIPSHRTKQVRAEVSKTIFLAFSFDNDFIDPLVEDLKNQCPNGVVTGILTKDEVISYFIVFTHRVVATGYCNGSIAKQGMGKRGTASETGSPIPEIEAEN